MKARAIHTLLSLAAVVALATAGCGADDGDEQPGGTSNGLEEGQGGEAGSGGEEVELNDYGLPIIPCPEELEFSLGMEATGEDGLFKARLVDADPSPPERYRNDWTIEFMDAGGTPLQDPELTESRSYMPAHQHDGGYPTEVSSLEEPGQLQVDNLNMFMGGPWEVQLTVTDGNDEDYIVFDVCIEE